MVVVVVVVVVGGGGGGGGANTMESGRRKVGRGAQRTTTVGQVGGRNE
jgi:hypothetical protein